MDVQVKKETKSQSEAEFENSFSEILRPVGYKTFAPITIYLVVLICLISFFNVIYRSIGEIFFTSHPLLSLILIGFFAFFLIALLRYLMLPNTPISYSNKRGLILKMPRQTLIFPMSDVHDVRYRETFGRFHNYRHGTVYIITAKGEFEILNVADVAFVSDKIWGLITRHRGW